MDNTYNKYTVGQQPVGKEIEPIAITPLNEQKYEKKGYGESIYADDTRNDKGVPDDDDSYNASKVARDSREEESQGI